VIAIRGNKSRRRRVTRRVAGPCDATTNPLYAVKLVGGRAVPTQAAIDAADAEAKAARERRAA
jgi:hypothetical protein